LFYYVLKWRYADLNFDAKGPTVFLGIS